MNIIHIEDKDFYLKDCSICKWANEGYGDYEYVDYTGEYSYTSNSIISACRFNVVIKYKKSNNNKGLKKYFKNLRYSRGLKNCTIFYNDKTYHLEEYKIVDVIFPYKIKNKKTHVVAKLNIESDSYVVYGENKYINNYTLEKIDEQLL